MSDLKKRNSKVNAGCAILAVLVYLLSYASGTQSYLKNLGYDLLFALRGPVDPPPEVVIVAIDEPSFGVFNLRWPWPRDLHAALIESLTRAGARTVALDIVFAENSTEEADQALKESMAAHGNVVLAADIQVINEESYQQIVRVMPASIFLSPGISPGFVTLPIDSDGIIRSVPTRDDEQFSFAYLAAAKYLDKACCVNLDDVGVQQNRINFHGPSRHIDTVSYYQALDYENALPDGYLRDKLVIVGLSSQSMVDNNNQSGDYFSFPLTRFNGGLMAGVEIQANAAANFIDDSFITTIPVLFVVLMAAVLALLVLYLILKTRPFVAAVSLLGMGVLVIGFAALLFTKYRLFLPVSDALSPPVLTFCFAFIGQFYIQYSDKNYVRKLFSAYVAPEILSKLESDISAFELGGSEVEASVLFMDIEGFTTLSEKIHPQELIRILNKILGQVTDAVIANHGLVNDYIGDAVMAIWNAPVEIENHADLACKTAIQIDGILKQINRDLALESPINVRVGVNSGKVINGNVGSEQHLKYTVLGDNVNLASRLEGINTAYGTRMIVSQATVELLKEKYILRQLDDIRVKGKSLPVRIFELGNSSLDADTINLYQDARKAYQESQWDRAIVMLEQILAAHPGDGPSAVLLDRCRSYRINPPEKGWDGVHTFTQK